MNRLKNFLIKYKTLLIFIPALVLYAFILHISKINCPIKYLTGISCAGCGMTRAYISLLKGDIAGAFNYHPLFILPPIVAIIIVNREKINQVLYKILLFTVLSVFVIVYLYRMVHGNGDVVVFEPENGLIIRTIYFFTRRINNVL